MALESGSFYPSCLFTLDHSVMRRPVFWKSKKLDKFSKFDKRVEIRARRVFSKLNNRKMLATKHTSISFLYCVENTYWQLHTLPFNIYFLSLIWSPNGVVRGLPLRRKRKRKPASYRNWRYECTENKARIPIDRILWHKKRLYCTGWWRNFRVQRRRKDYKCVGVGRGWFTNAHLVHRTWSEL